MLEGPLSVIQAIASSPASLSGSSAASSALSHLRLAGFALLFPLSYLRYLLAVRSVATFCYPTGSRHWLRRRVRMVCWSAVRRDAVHRWLSGVASSGLMQRVAHARPTLLEKPYRPLGRLGMPFTERAQLVCDHYRLMGDLVSVPVCEQIYLHGGLEGVHATGQAEGRYVLRFADAGRNPKEGELAFYWMDSEHGTCLSQLSFYLAQGKAGPEIFVGGLQGPVGAESRDRIRASTKACDGLRPKDAVMEALLAFAAAIGAQRIVAVSRHNHVGLQRYTPRVILSDYDAFWMESGGSALPCGNVEVPVSQPPRDISEIPSKKRSAYRRKCERAAAIRAMVAGWLDGAGQPTVG